MNSWKVIIATLVIFGAGVVTGGLVVTYAVRVNGSPNPSPNIAAANPQQRPLPVVTPWQLRNRELLRRMDRELDLTPEQHGHIEKIIADSQERTKALWKPIAPQMSREMQRVHGLIRDELNRDQQKKYDELTKPHGPKKGDDSYPPNRPGGQRRMTNIPPLEAPAGTPAPAPQQ